MKQRNIAFLGISGVGKSTFLRSMGERVRFQRLTGGSLIAAAKAKGSLSYDALRLKDIERNQELLIDGFRMKRDPDYQIAILDGHMVIDTDSHLETIDVQVFQALQISAFMHLNGQPSEIATQRTDDASRLRPARTVLELEMHQRASELATQKAAELLSVPFASFVAADAKDAEAFILSAQDSLSE